MSWPIVVVASTSASAAAISAATGSVEQVANHVRRSDCWSCRWLTLACRSRRCHQFPICWWSSHASQASPSDIAGFRMLDSGKLGAGLVVSVIADFTGEYELFVPTNVAFTTTPTGTTSLLGVPFAVSEIENLASKQIIIIR